MKSFRRFLSRALRYARKYRNWIEILTADRNGKPISRLILRNGIKLHAPIDSSAFLFMVDEIFTHHVYSPPGFEIHPEDIVIDIGANIGVFSIFASIQGASRVISIEPEPKNYQYLLENISHNKIDNITGVNRAVAGNEGEIKLWDSGVSTGHLIYDRNIEGSLTSFITVKSTTLEAIIVENKIPHVNFLKIDCEGAEGEIIKSLSVSTASKIFKMAIEFHNNVSILSHKEIFEVLSILGYNVQVKWDGVSSFGYIYANKMSG